MRYVKQLLRLSIVLLIFTAVSSQQSTLVLAEPGARLAQDEFATFLTNGEIKLFLDKGDGAIKGIEYGKQSLSCSEGFFSYYIYPMSQNYGADNRGKPLGQAGQKVTIGESKNTDRGMIIPPPMSGKNFSCLMRAVISVLVSG